jgi:hypothetical protein
MSKLSYEEGYNALMNAMDSESESEDKKSNELDVKNRKRKLSDEETYNALDAKCSLESGEENFLNCFQIEQESQRKNYDIVKNNKRTHNPLDPNSVKYLEYMETYDYTKPNNKLPTPFILIEMHSSLDVYYDDLLKEPYYETLPSPINMWRLKPAPLHTISSGHVIETAANDILKINTPHDTSDTNIEKYFTNIIDTSIFTKNFKGKLFEIEQKYIENERNSIVYTNQKEFYINKKYNKSNGIILCNDITFELPIKEDEDLYMGIVKDISSKMNTIYGKLNEVGKLILEKETKYMVNYKKGDHINKCLYFISYCSYINTIVNKNNEVKLIEFKLTEEETNLEVNNADLFTILTYFKNCDKLVCTDVSCETVNIKSNTLNNIFNPPRKYKYYKVGEKIEKPKINKEKNELKNKIKEMRSTAKNSKLRGGKKKKTKRKSNIVKKSKKNREK